MNTPLVDRDDFWADLINAIFLRPVYRTPSMAPTDQPLADAANEEVDLNREADASLRPIANAQLFQAPLSRDESLAVDAEARTLFRNAKLHIEVENYAEARADIALSISLFRLLAGAPSTGSGVYYPYREAVDLRERIDTVISRRQEVAKPPETQRAKNVGSDDNETNADIEPPPVESEPWNRPPDDDVK